MFAAIAASFFADLVVISALIVAAQTQENLIVVFPTSQGAARMAKRMNVILKMEINALANLFYRLHGYNQKDNYDFSVAVHPQEKLMWAMAKYSFDFWEQRLAKSDSTDTPRKG
jgi:hypothetical protein